MDIRNGLEIRTTVVSNEFIDRYMASANGEFVKVYLYILRHQQRPMEVAEIADALHHTEADVRRALSYWEKLGILQTGRQSNVKDQSAEQTASGASAGTAAAETGSTGIVPPRRCYTQEQVSRLSGDDDFSQLVYIAQKYLSKIFTQRDMETFAYLYDGLHMDAELLEYLVEHCVQSGHTSIRYIETVGISWYEKGFTTAAEARAYAESFTKNSFCVMKAFGLTNRKPGEQEKEAIDRWFHTYGFSRELVLEACNRTMNATHAPSFQYAERILSGWKKAGVKTMRDVTEADKRYQAQAKTRPAERSQACPANQFHNFEQRNTDYDATALDDVLPWLKR